MISFGEKPVAVSVIASHDEHEHRRRAKVESHRNKPRLQRERLKYPPRYSARSNTRLT